MKRVIVIGSSCSGKTTLARRLAELLGSPHIKLDALHWGPDWSEVPRERFRAALEKRVEGDRWVVDGNYSAVRDIVWERATDAELRRPRDAGMLLANLRRGTDKESKTLRSLGLK